MNISEQEYLEVMIGFSTHEKLITRKISELKQELKACRELNEELRLSEERLRQSAKAYEGNIKELQESVEVLNLENKQLRTKKPAVIKGNKQL